MRTIGQLGREFGLSRSTLLYYDSIGLLCPKGRSAAGYRLYSEDDRRRLEHIRLYRRAGLKLEDIGRILDSPDNSLTSLLEERLEELNDEIMHLRDQQRVVIGLLKDKSLEEKIAVMNRQTWVGLLAASGFSDEDMWRWHADFERRDPDRHQKFLEFLCVPAEEIRLIREHSRR